MQGAVLEECYGAPSIFLIRHIDCAAAAGASQQQLRHGDQRHAGHSRALPDRGRQAAYPAQQCQGEQMLKLSRKYRDNFRLHTINILTYEQAGRQEVHLPPILPVLASPASAPASAQFPATRVKLVKLWSTINTRLENSAAGKRPSSTLVCRYK